MMVFTFYQFSQFSLFTGRSGIVYPLMLRGVAIGMLFAPLMTMAISEISHQKMAQASGLLNVVRQIGGSFGVAVFGTILTRRTIYHTATYGEQVNAYSNSFQQTVLNLQSWAMHTAGSAAGKAAVQAKALIGSFIGTQAFIQAVDDVFLLAGVVLLLGIVPLLIVRTRHYGARSRPGGKPAQAQVE
jgi:DHA2 family multidrug resistance protein